MDTNVKKWTDKRWVKVTALLLSIVLFTCTAGLVFRLFYQVEMFGETVFYSAAQKRQLTFTDQDNFYTEFSSDLEIIAAKTGSYATEALQQQLAAEFATKSADFVNTYNEAKANFIRSYLFDSLCQEDIYENYAAYFNVDAVVNVPQITIEKRVLVDAYAPEFVQKLQKILNGTDGTGFLRYAGLIPTRVFAGAAHTGNISFDWNESSFDTGFSYTLDLADPAAYYKTVYDNFAKEIDISGVHSGSVLPASLQYYIVDPKNATTFTNTAYEQKQWLDYFAKSKIHVSVLQGEVSQQGLAPAENDRLLADRFSEELNVYVVLDIENTPADDKYVLYKAEFDGMVAQDFRWMLVLLGLCAVLSVGSLIFLLVITVKRRLWIDRLPIELHLLISVICGGGILMLGIEILSAIDGYYFDYAGGLMTLAALGFCLLAALGWAVVCELCCSLTRTVKSRETNLLILRIGGWLVRNIRNALGHLREMLAYRPGTMRKYVIPLVVIWAIADVILLFLLFATRSAGVFLLFLVLQFVLAFKLVDYLQQLDKIIYCAAGRLEYTGDISRLPGSLRRLVESQQYTQDELQHAIEKAITDERTKAELITNVSHDLKTPLTSVINYIDLLQRCDISDETAKEYLSVLEEKSARLKRLIEDLIEASKVSTGNVVLHKTELSLGELADQAVVEESDGMEAQQLELVYTLHASPTVYADGSKLYRVLENLLTNARKYSLPGTRVYATVYEDEKFGYFELKNISREALDIAPEELTDRFVRGDRSRSEEGNGLGLSIAKDLCRLNDGELLLTIDGDLFKATVKLPKCPVEPKIVP